MLAWLISYRLRGGGVDQRVAMLRAAKLVVGLVTGYAIVAVLAWTSVVPLEIEVWPLLGASAVGIVAAALLLVLVLRGGSAAWWRPVGYAAAGLMLAQGMLSASWAAGGTAGLALLAEGVREQAASREPWFVSLVWGVALVKLGLGATVLAPVRDWSLPPRWLVLLVVWLAGAGMLAYGALNLAGFTLVLLDVIPGPGTRDTAYRAYLLLWTPLWLAIGLLYLIAAWGATAEWRAGRADRSMTATAGGRSTGCAGGSVV